MLSEIRLKRRNFVIFDGEMPQAKKVAAETKLTEEEKLFEEKKAVNPNIAGFYRVNGKNKYREDY